MFTKFLNDGKATIRFKDPEQDICISKVCTVESDDIKYNIKVSSLKSREVIRKKSIGQTVQFRILNPEQTGN